MCLCVNVYDIRLWICVALCSNMWISVFMGVWFAFVCLWVCDLHLCVSVYVFVCVTSICLCWFVSCVLCVSLCFCVSHCLYVSCVWTSVIVLYCTLFVLGPICVCISINAFTVAYVNLSVFAKVIRSRDIPIMSTSWCDYDFWVLRWGPVVCYLPQIWILHVALCSWLQGVVKQS